MSACAWARARTRECVHERIQASLRALHAPHVPDAAPCAHVSALLGAEVVPRGHRPSGWHEA
eukprot:3593722-Alexandrium_andersonii.AAC.1